MPIKIRPLEPNDFPDWLVLWDGNNLGQRKEDVTAETWSRLINPDSAVNGLVAVLRSPPCPPASGGEENAKPFSGGEEMIGLVHYIEHPVTGHIKPVCYMQDVYVAPEHRQKGIAKKLVSAVAKIGEREKRWVRMYWLAESNNIAAQNLYKSLGVKLNFTLHILPME